MVKAKIYIREGSINMEDLKNIIKSNHSDLYDIGILKKEIELLEKDFDKSEFLLAKTNEYKDKYRLLSNNFREEFKILNRRHSELVKSIKTSNLVICNELERSVLIEAERKVLNNVKEAFQSIVDNKEKILRTYELLSEVTFEKLDSGKNWFVR